MSLGNLMHAGSVEEVKRYSGGLKDEYLSQLKSYQARLQNEVFNLYKGLDVAAAKLEVLKNEIERLEK